TTACFTCFIRLRSGTAKSHQNKPSSTCSRHHAITIQLWQPDGGSAFTRRCQRREAGDKYRHVAENHSVGRVQSAGRAAIAPPLFNSDACEPINFALTRVRHTDASGRLHPPYAPKSWCQLLS